MGTPKALSTRGKLLLLVSLPLLVMAVYASVYSVERLHELDDARDLQHLARATQLLGTVHSLQNERSRAVGLAVAPSATTEAAWREAVTQSLSVESQLPALERQLRTEQAPDVMFDALLALRHRMGSLSEVRARLTNEPKVPVLEVQRQYNQVIRAIHRQLNALFVRAADSRIFRLSAVLMAIAEMKEVQSRILGTTLGMLNTQTLAADRHLVELTANYELLRQRFLNIAPAEYKDMFEQLDGIAETGEAPGGEAPLGSEAGNRLRADSEQWLALANSQMDALRQIEERINQNLHNYASTQRSKATRSLTTTVLLAAGTSILVLLVVWVATGRFASGITRLRDAAVQFTETGVLEPVAVSTRDELGALANAFNRMLSELRAISYAAEAVAEGDFSHQRPVKSDADRLSLSLNHMITRLKDSLQVMQADNWIKTGQSAFAEQSNLDQSLQELTDKSITFIAEYLHAPVAALYTVDPEGRARLISGYAHPAHPAGDVQFAKGEGLVGQVVAGAKSIVVDDLPEGYLDIRTGLGEAAVHQLLLLPLLYGSRVLGVLEIGLLRGAATNELQLLEQTSERLAVAIHAAQAQERMAALLEETQAQAEELMSQQQELEHTNAELEQQAQQLEESKHELMTQKSQLQSTNEMLQEKSREAETRNRELEARSQDLLKTRTDLEANARELTLASKYKTEFLANMSHELRSPLNSLLLLAQSLFENDENNLTPEQLEAIDIIKGSGQDLLTLINDILDLSKVEAGKLVIEPESCDLQAIIKGLERQFSPEARARGVRFETVHVAGAPETITTDPQRLQQILRNLLSNAFKFTERGEVVLSVTGLENSVFFDVRDTGIGISPDLQKEVFEAFQQGDGSTRRKYAGTGLGLTISRELAHLLGGDIHLESTPGEGSRFRLQLPLGDSRAKSLPATQADSLSRSTTPPEASQVLPFPSIWNAQRDLLLIIEDDKALAASLEALARKRNFVCRVAASASEGIKIVQSVRPRAIILDNSLPDGTGAEVIAQLREQPATIEVPIHLISSEDHDPQCADAIGTIAGPISDDAINSAYTTILKHLYGASERKVLVIEDDSATRAALETLLSKQGVATVHAATGKQGLALAASESPACLVLDLNLPDMDSLEILKEVAGERAERPLPVIIYTGRDLSHEDYKSLRRYTNHIIIKGNLAEERLLNDVTLFLHSVAHEGETRSGAPEPDVLKDKKVLVVDDDMRNAFALAKLLRRHGLEVELADNGRLALERLEGDSGIAMAIMDIMMPEMDGYETIRKIREVSDYKHLPIIALTANAMPQDRDKCLSVGANDYLTKPVDADRLLSTLRLWASV